MSGVVFLSGYKMLNGKELTIGKPIITLLPQGDLVFPLTNENGNVSKAVVNKGDKVLVGQVLCEGLDNKSANIISSVSGIVKNIEERLMANGKKSLAVIIENDNEYLAVEDYGVESDYNKLSKEEIINKIKNAGVVGLGGSGNPTYLKLKQKSFDKITNIIINAVETDMFLTSDYSAITEMPDKVLLGADILLKLFENAKINIAIGANMTKAIKLLEEENTNNKITIKPVKANHPIGEERNLVHKILGTKLSMKVPLESKGIIVNNVSTLIAIYDAVKLGTPLTEKIVTVTGDGIAKPTNFKVKVGTNYNELIEAAGGPLDGVKKVVSGTVMGGQALISLDVPVTKTTKGIVLFLHEFEEDTASACIRCGKCYEVCSKNLLPARLAAFADKGNEDGFIKLNGMECCECGNCTFICPARRKVSHSIKLGKTLWAEK